MNLHLLPHHFPRPSLPDHSIIDSDFTVNLIATATAIVTTEHLAAIGLVVIITVTKMAVTAVVERLQVSARVGSLHLQPLTQTDS